MSSFNGINKVSELKKIYENNLNDDSCSEKEITYICEENNTVTTKRCKKDFGSKTFRMILNDYISDNYNNSEKKPKIHLADVALNGLNMNLCIIIIENAIKNVTSDNNIFGSINVDYTVLFNSIGSDDDLRKIFLGQLSFYDPSMTYYKQYNITKQNIDKHIDNNIFHKINLNMDAFNLLVFLLLKTTMNIIRTADTIRKCNKNGSINHKMIISSIDVVFNFTQKANFLMSKVTDIIIREEKINREKKLNRAKQKLNKNDDNNEIADDDSEYSDEENNAVNKNNVLELNE